MGMQTGEFYVAAHREVGVHAVVRVAGRNLERTVGSGKSQNALFGRLLGENDAEFRLVPAGMAMRRVVHLEDDVRAGLDKLGLAWPENFGGLPGGIAHQEVAR